MSTTPTWYDLLGVDETASADEIRSAWKASIADLEPGARRFDSLNRAAKVLLDPAARAEYDATLADEGLVTGLRPSSTTEVERPSTKIGAEPDDRAPRGRSLLARAVPTWLLAALAVLAVASVVALAVLWTRDDGDSGAAAREAQQAAERAVVPVLSYDHRSLEDSQQAAQAEMTSRYRKEYDKLFALLEENAPDTGTVVTAEVVSSGIVRSGEDRVQVLVFVDRPTTNKQTSTPVVYRDQVTLSMQRVGDQWLVDDMVTTPVSE